MLLHGMGRTIHSSMIWVGDPWFAYEVKTDDFREIHADGIDPL